MGSELYHLEKGRRLSEARNEWSGDLYDALANCEWSTPWAPRPQKLNKLGLAFKGLAKMLENVTYILVGGEHVISRVVSAKIRMEHLIEKLSRKNRFFKRRENFNPVV